MSLKREETKLEAIRLDQEGYTQGEIAEILLGSSTKSSTIGDFLRKETHIGWWTQKEEFFKAASSMPTGKDNSRVLFISDLHAPYNHPKALNFLQDLKDKYAPTRIISLGDECDKHSLSYHDSDPDLMSAGDELKAAQKTIQALHEIFPEMDVIESNHGSLVWRKAKTHGIPRHYIRPYNEVLGVGDGWKWVYDLTLDLPNGQKCYVCHGKTTDVTKLSQQMGMCAVQGHYHEKFKIEYWANPTGLYWGMQSGCLVDDESYAFAYNNTNIKRPIIGTSLIIDSKPVLEAVEL